MRSVRQRGAAVQRIVFYAGYILRATPYLETLYPTPTRDCLMSWTGARATSRAVSITSVP